MVVSAALERIFKDLARSRAFISMCRRLRLIHLGYYPENNAKSKYVYIAQAHSNPTTPIDQIYYSNPLNLYYSPLNTYSSL